ncbi:S-adenosyl-L-methionine-dependent methyltransferase, partial [Obelidium mucronatum]
MGSQLSKFQERRRQKGVLPAQEETVEVPNTPAPEAADGSDQSARTSMAGTSINESIAATWRPEDAEDRRRYHAVEASDYVLPNDDREQTRLELQHRMLRYAFGSDVVCPEARKIIKRHGAKVLDVGCANGAWMDSLFTAGNVNCEYHGVDVAEDAFEFGTVCGAKIVVGNVLEGLPYEDNTFDYVHQRMLVLGIPKEKWPQVFRELIRVTKPGGWIELLEVDTDVYRTGPIATTFSKSMFNAFEKRGLEPHAGSNLVHHATNSGSLTNIGSKTVSLPLAWNGELGNLHAKDVRGVFLNLSGFMSKVLGVSIEEYSAMVDQCVVEWSETKAFANYFSAYGQVHKA